MAKVLITGCAGFIGYKVCEEFLKNDYEVIGIDNFDPYYDLSLKEYRLNYLKNYNNFNFVLMDIRDKNALRNLFKIYNFEGVINLAAKAGVRASILNPKDYFDVNVIGTLNILELMLEFNVNKIILASTSSIYAGHKPPFKEDMKCDNMLSPYAVSKKCAENLVYTFYHLYDISSIILRYFTVYGPAGRPDMSIFRFIYWMLKDKEIIIYGDGNQRRSFTYVEDVANATFLAYKLNGFEIINVGNDQDNKLIDVVNKIGEILNKEPKIIYEPFNKADIYETKADITKARKLLNWEPKIKIEEGLKRTIDWFLENKDLIDSFKL
ncbi:MAG: NAD-dependent epimerase/dehydratase family protein [candidate division WOR-3 bacterium]